MAFESLQPSAALRAYAAALDVTSDAVAIIDRTGRIAHANQATEALLGTGNLTGRSLAHFCALDARELRDIVRGLRARKAWSGRLGLQTPNGCRHIQVSLRPVARAQGRAHHFCVGIKPLREAETALAAVGRVAGEMAHDFNNQIAVVLNYSFILLRQLPQTSPLREHVAEMQNAAWHASDLASDMLQFAGPRNTETDTVDLNALLESARALLDHALPEAVHIERLFAADLWPVRGRRAHLEWLLLEIVSRLRSALGSIAYCSITTRNREEAGTRSVVLQLEALPGATRLAASGCVRRSERRPGAGGAELALTHVCGELSTQALPDGGLRYCVSFPVL
jgi:nitrogen-specific signal transduction histidine kinase